MRRLWILITVCAAAAAQTAHQNHPPRSAEEYKRALNDPRRDEWQKPHEVIQALGLKPGDAVADIGAGTGYFSLRFARHAGKVYAVDISESLLEWTRKGAPENLTGVLAAPDDPKLSAGSVDLIFFCNVLHHVENRAAYYPKLERALKPGGRIAILEFYKKKLPVGPPESMKLTESEVIAELEAAGFKKTSSFEFLPYQYFFLFERK